MSAMPPITPPTMAPICDVLDALAGKPDDVWDALELADDPVVEESVIDVRIKEDEEVEEDFDGDKDEEDDDDEDVREVAPGSGRTTVM